MGTRATSRGLGLYAVAVLATVQAGGSAPTPLYGYYQAEWALPPLILTVVFAAYPVSLLAALLTAGPLSDHLGRRPVLLVGLLLCALAMGLLASAGTASELIAARLVQGFATGVAASTLGAVMLDVDREGGALVNSVTAFMGTTLGVFGSSLLVEAAPAPRILVYAVLSSAFLAEVLALAWMPETVVRKSGALASLWPAVEVPPRARRTFLLVSPANVAGWALGGFYLSLMPGVLLAALGITSPFTAGIVVTTLTMSGSAAILVLRTARPSRALALGAMALACGVTASLGGVHLGSAGVVLAGTAVSGAGFGASFFGAARTVLPLAEANERAALLSAFYVESYLAFRLPAVLMVLAIPRLGLLPVTDLYGGLTVTLALVFLLSARWFPPPPRAQIAPKAALPEG